MVRPKKVVVSPSLSVRSRLMGIGGQRADGSPDVGRIAARVGRSPRTVARWLSSDKIPARTESKVSALEAADARKPAWIPPADEGPVGQSLIGGKAGRMPAVTDVHGSLLTSWSRPDGTVDTRAAAADLGVSQRTVQRWAKGQARPKIESQEKIRSSVRETLLTGKRGSRMSNQGAQVQLTAQISIDSGKKGRRDTRRRTIGQGERIQLSGQDMDRIAQAYTKGGDAAASIELSRAVAYSRYGRTCGMDALSVSEISAVTFYR